MPRALRLSLPALLLALVSCTTNGGNAFIVATKIVLPTGLDPTTGLCLNRAFSPDAKETIYANFGTDLPLQMGLVLEDRMPQTPANDTRLNSNDFTATSLVIKYESAGSAAINLPERTIAAQGYVKAGGSGAAAADVISVADATTLKGQMGTDLYVRLNVHAVGYLTDGSTVHSSDYTFLVQSGPKSSQCQAQ